MSYDKIPIHTLESMKRYVEHGIPPGDFLEAVFANDLLDAVGRADGNNSRAIRAIASWVYQEAPGTCHGSRQKVKDWIETHFPQVKEESCQRK